MKNSIKIQTEIMKHIKRYNEGKVPRNAVYTEVDDKKTIIVTMDGYVAYFFNSTDFYIDKSKMEKNDHLKNFYDVVKDQEPITPTGISKKIKTGMTVELENKNFKVYIDEKFIKIFDKVENLGFVGKGETKPVYVYEFDELVGFIMPIRMPKNKD